MIKNGMEKSNYIMIVDLDLKEKFYMEKEMEKAKNMIMMVN